METNSWSEDRIFPDLMSVSKSNALGKFIRDFPSAPPEELLAYLKSYNFDLERSKLVYTNSLRWRKSYKYPTIAEIAPFLRSRPQAGGPDGGVFLLESRGMSDCARDREGRPILVSIGLVHGSKWEMHRQGN